MLAYGTSVVYFCFSSMWRAWILGNSFCSCAGETFIKISTGSCFVEVFFLCLGTEDINSLYKCHICSCYILNWKMLIFCYDMPCLLISTVRITAESQSWPRVQSGLFQNNTTSGLFVWGPDHPQLSVGIQLELIWVTDVCFLLRSLHLWPNFYIKDLY